MSYWPVRGEFPSTKVGNLIPFYSRFQQRYLCLLEFDTAVSYFQTRPFAINFEWNGQKDSFTPDFYVIKNNQNHLVQITNPEYQFGEGYQERLWAIKVHCTANKIYFDTINPQCQKLGTLLGNVGFLHQFAHHQIPKSTQKQIIAFLEANSPVSIHELSSKLSDDNPNDAIVPLMNMAWNHQIILEIHENSISPKTVVSLP